MRSSALPKLCAVLGLAFVSALTGCGVSGRVEKCNRLIREVNAGLDPITTMLAAEPALAKGSAEAERYDALAKRYEDASKRMQTLQLDNRKLDGVKGSYKTLYEQTARACSKYAKAARRDSSTLKRASRNELKRLVSRDENLAKRVRGMCQ